MEEDSKMLRFFMKPTSGDSNAKAELRAQQMRQTKRKEIREGLRTKLRDYAPQLNNTNELQGISELKPWESIPLRKSKETTRRAIQKTGGAIWKLPAIILPHFLNNPRIKF